MKIMRCMCKLYFCIPIRMLHTIGLKSLKFLGHRGYLLIQWVGWGWGVSPRFSDLSAIAFKI